MNPTMRALIILLIVVAIGGAFLLGTATATGTVPAAPQALTLAEWAAVEASNSLLLNQGPFRTYLPVVVRR
jgi:hypothetical protein